MQFLRGCVFYCCTYSCCCCSTRAPLYNNHQHRTHSVVLITVLDFAVLFSGDPWCRPMFVMLAAHVKCREYFMVGGTYACRVIAVALLCRCLCNAAPHYQVLLCMSAVAPRWLALAQQQHERHPAVVNRVHLVCMDSTLVFYLSTL